MKKSDMISIALTAMIGIFASWFLVNIFMGNPDEAKVSYKDIEVVQPDLAVPSADIFNSDAINPTIEVYVGDCVDVDQDGSLSQAELVACGRADSLDDSSSDKNQDQNENQNENEDGDTEVKVEEETNTTTGNEVKDDNEVNANTRTTKTKKEQNNGAANSRNTR